jgi:polysaccharide biosynthesis protein PslG
MRAHTEGHRGNSPGMMFAAPARATLPLMRRLATLLLLICAWLCVPVADAAQAGTAHGKRASSPTARHCKTPSHRRVVARQATPGLPYCLIKLGRSHSLAGGYNEDWPLRVGEVRLAGAGGARLLRFPADWGTVQPSGPGSWDWSLLDQIHAQAAASGVRLIFEAYGSPCWAHPSLGCPGPFGGSPPDPVHLEHWGAFIAAAAGRYPDLAAIEVWNEPNLQPFWSIAPDPERYASLLTAARRALADVPSRPPLLFGGLAPLTSDGPGSISYQRFLARALDAGAAGNFDALAIHPYALPFNRPDYLAETRRLLGAARLILARRGLGDTPIWATEIGFSTAGSGAVSPNEQANRLARLWQLLKRIPGVEAAVVHRFFDQPGGGSESGWGVVGATGEPKPAFHSLAERFRAG